MSGLVDVDVAGSVGAVMNGLDHLFTSDDERAKAELLLQQEFAKPHLMQAQINLEEAKHPSIFVAGWRPALGWLCVILLAYAWIGRDLIIIGLGLAGQADVIKEIPAVDTSELFTLVMSLLGLGGIRAYEKTQGVARSSWKAKGDKQ